MACVKPRELCRAYLALGSNLQDPVAQVETGFRDLAGLPETRLLVRSSLYRSAPVGAPGQPDYVNAVAAVETRLGPTELLEAMLSVEHHRGRVRAFQNAPRTLDLDLLLYEDLVCHQHGLTLPHPRMHERAFVLVPLAEIAPDCEIPGRGPVSEWLARCAGQAIEKL
ncbi:MAG: 2-amino-4-hydroxy-6-hydroxymethyldihydropteridine diphosphokinase [Betaproteobacteria bacterium]|nr:2-amino-4-hydroxy-6-hydroxymethyldihydropteridine diphosphokinase [Betaproteobacteria bacterium]